MSRSRSENRSLGDEDRSSRRRSASNVLSRGPNWWGGPRQREHRGHDLVEAALDGLAPADLQALRGRETGLLHRLLLPGVIDAGRVSLPGARRGPQISD